MLCGTSTGVSRRAYDDGWSPVLSLTGLYEPNWIELCYGGGWPLLIETWAEAAGGGIGAATKCYGTFIKMPFLGDCVRI